MNVAPVFIFYEGQNRVLQKEVTEQLLIEFKLLDCSFLIFNYVVIAL